MAVGKRSAADRIRDDATHLLDETEAVLSLSFAAHYREEALVRGWRDKVAALTSQELKAGRTELLRDLEKNLAVIRRTYSVAGSRDDILRYAARVRASGFLILTKRKAVGLFGGRVFRRFSIPAVPSYATVSCPGPSIDLPERNLFRDASCLVLLAKRLSSVRPVFFRHGARQGK